MLEANYELCVRNNCQLIQDLIIPVSEKATVTPMCTKCLQELAVANQIPVHRNQQQILRAVVSTRGDCLQGIQRVASLSNPERQWLLAVVELVCTCCIGHDHEAQGLAQGLMPLPWLLKMIVEADGDATLEEQMALLRCLREVWWAWHGADLESAALEANWWNVTDPWWKTWCAHLCPVAGECC